jgi:hypothetical protein
MQNSNPRVFALVGIVATAAAALVMLATIPGLPVLAVLAVSGAAHYGVLASSVNAVVVAAGLLVLRVVPGRAEGVSIHREAQYQ